MFNDKSQILGLRVKIGLQPNVTSDFLFDGRWPSTTEEQHMIFQALFSLASTVNNINVQVKDLHYGMKLQTVGTERRDWKKADGFVCGLVFLLRYTVDYI